MAITQTMPTSAKWQFLTGYHTPAHTYKIALYTNAATLGAATTAYASTNEISGSAYIAGGQTLTGYASGSSGTTAYVTFSNPSWANAQFTARGALIYNTSGSAAVAVLDFGQDFTATYGTFSITFPAAGASAIITIG